MASTNASQGDLEAAGEAFATAVEGAGKAASEASKVYQKEFFWRLK